mgnify:CR=1 FL=1
MEKNCCFPHLQTDPSLCLLKMKKPCSAMDMEFLKMNILIWRMAVLNSKVMEYYVANTSYAIEGGYYCYQKKYIERFSIPEFDEDERKLLRTGNRQEVDEMLLEKYDLVI